MQFGAGGVQRFGGGAAFGLFRFSFCAAGGGFACDALFFGGAGCFDFGTAGGFGLFSHGAGTFFCGAGLFLGRSTSSGGLSFARKSGRSGEGRRALRLGGGAGLGPGGLFGTARVSCQPYLLGSARCIGLTGLFRDPLRVVIDRARLDLLFHAAVIDDRLQPLVDPRRGFEQPVLEFLEKCHWTSKLLVPSILLPC